MRHYLLVVTRVGLVALLSGASFASAQSVGNAGSFAIVGGTTVTAGGAPSVITGDVGVSPGTSITGFPVPASTVPPYSTHANDAAAVAAQASTLSLYNTLAATGGATPIGAGLGGTVRTPGVYSTGAADLAAASNLTLDGAGIYIFQMASSLTANVGSTVTLINGANACSVFWQVTSAATLNGVNFAGNVVAQANVTVGVGDILTGRALVTSLGSVTMAGGNSIGGCSSAAVGSVPTPTVINACALTAPDLFLTKTHSGTFAVGVNATYSIAVGNNGTTPGSPITVTDTLPGTLAFVSAAGTSWTCSSSGQTISCTSTVPNPGAISLVVTPNINAVPAVTNRAVVSGGGDCDASNNAVADIAVVAAAVPTLSQWAFVLLAVMLGAAGALMLRRRQAV